MLNKIFYSIFLAIVVFFPQYAYAAIVFQDNFNDSPDWQSKQNTVGAGGGLSWPNTYSETCTTYCPPKNWTSYRAAVSRWAPNARDTYVLNSDGARGNGKGITYNIESSGCYGTPCWSGGAIDKYLGPTGYPELFVRFWLKEPKEFCWASPELNLNGQGKFLRIVALRQDPTIDPRAFNPQQMTAITSPIFIPDAYHRFQPNYQIPAQFLTTVRYAPNYEDPTGPGTIYSAQIPNDSTTGGLGYCGDDQWHSYEFYVKLNSSLGAADGIYRIWLDGNLVAERTNLPWIKPGIDSYGTEMSLNTGWNWIMLADNIDSTAYPETSKIEMSRFIDDVVMYTPMNGAEQECAGACTNGRLPQSYTQGNLDNVPPLAPSNLAVL